MRNSFTLWLRIALIAEWLLVAVGVTAGLAVELGRPSEGAGDAVAVDDVAFGPVRWTVMAVSLLLWVAGSVGSFFLWRHGRMLYLAGVITGTALTPLLGPFEQVAPLELVVTEASLIVSGLALGILYFSPLRDHFGSVSTPRLTLPPTPT